MLLDSPRKVVSAALLAASLTTLSAACDQQRPATGAPPSDSTGGGPAPSGSIRCVRAQRHAAVAVVASNPVPGAA